MRALVLTGFGINCEEEFAAAYRLAGAEATIVHFNQVLHGQVSIHDFDVLNFPGGFSFGDDLGSGVVLANKLRYRQTSAAGRTLLDDIKQFIADGKFVLGICNGFQVLVKLGLLPNLGGDVTPEVTLTHNASGRYEDRWVTLRVNPAARTPFLTGIDRLEVPVRHGEGRLVVPDEATRAAIEAAGLNCLSYIDANGDGTSEYPLNPNGADLNCAGLTDPTGQVFGLMPHPEAFLAAYNHPDWARRRRQSPGASEEGEGLQIFKNIVAHIRKPHPPAPSPAGEGGPDGHFVAEEGRPYYERRQRREESLHTSIEHDVFTAGAGGKWEALKQFSREMRKAPTPAEDVLWQEVRGQKLGVAFRRQHAIAGYIVDFVTLADKLIVEVDGEIHDQPDQADYDHGRTQLLQEHGYRIIRFTNQQVLNELLQVIQRIQHELASA
ncbi:phosphoribosylformylglycinamidine synthase subunit PurQ [Microvirga sp. STS02]|uniref:phosphoribosylformylglycinamidine synthase subunit PurQ n=1 Tax=Hymenobacter negativus TaxID=2795026 RepID=UPI0018DC5C43|nr:MULTISPECIES: phosphoribosylformylglycinamidine synthase subunit PurQ [Bacteria]MBH8568546.1 phosphoribosylformylglycinamidine synthase subunit PurQ [Hymenobacter negativus]MBR7208280.1 phosphoribosylformylglycinamidine synthase subunit PurQ [Microvirga sp. STS02]